jgi:hypothetical protein
MRIRSLTLALILTVALTRTAGAQLLVTDPIHTGKLITIGQIQKAAESVIAFIDDETRRFGRPFSLFEDLRRYVSPDAPLWRTRRVDPALPQTVAFMDAVNGGDTAGVLTDQALVPRTLPMADVSTDLRVDLATLDLADSALHSAIETTGQIRGRRREELNAITAAVDHLVGNGSVEKALDKISGDAVIRAQQQSTRLALTSSTLDLLLVRGKRMRDGQAEHLMLSASALQEAPNMVAGSGAAIASWRQP